MTALESRVEAPNTKEVNNSGLKGEVGAMMTDPKSNDSLKNKDAGTPPGSLPEMTLFDGNSPAAGPKSGLPGAENGNNSPKAAGDNGAAQTAPGDAGAAPKAPGDAGNAPKDPGSDSSAPPPYDLKAGLARMDALEHQLAPMKDAQGNSSAPDFATQQKLADQLQEESIKMAANGHGGSSVDSESPSKNPDSVTGIKINASATDVSLTIWDKNGAMITRDTPMKDGVAGETVSKDTPGKQPSPSKNDTGATNGGDGGGYSYDAPSAPAKSQANAPHPVLIDTGSGLVSATDNGSGTIIDGSGNQYYYAPQGQ